MRAGGPGSKLVLCKVFIYRRGLSIVDCVDKPEIVNPGIFEKILGIVKPVKWFSFGYCLSLLVITYFTSMVVSLRLETVFSVISPS